MTNKSPELDPRVLMAAERTLLANRTGVAMMGFGFVVARFGLFLREMAEVGGQQSTHHLRASPIVGVGLIVAGAVVTALATAEHVGAVRAYERGEPMRVKVISLVTLVAGPLVISGIGLAAYLIVV